MKYFLNGQPVRRSKALAHVIDAWLKFHRTATSAMEYFAMCERNLQVLGTDAEVNAARAVVAGDAFVTFQDDP